MSSDRQLAVRMIGEGFVKFYNLRQNGSKRTYCKIKKTLERKATVTDLHFLERGINGDKTLVFEHDPEKQTKNKNEQVENRMRADLFFFFFWESIIKSLGLKTKRSVNTLTMRSLKNRVMVFRVRLNIKDN